MVRWAIAADVFDVLLTTTLYLGHSMLMFVFRLFAIYLCTPSLDIRIYSLYQHRYKDFGLISTSI